MKKLALVIGVTAAFGMNSAQADQVFLDDLIVDGSACVGQDCVNGESFGFDTIRLKENNLRIRFVDTSTTASFPSVDWQLTANDSANGGANKFSIDEIDSARTPFSIIAGAPSHSLYVNSSGNIGVGTSTPIVQVHVKDGNTPTTRLEQDGSSGFTPQTWDVAGNETNFFIRDATNGSTLPFRIRPGAPSSAIDIAASGNVGIGTDSPSYPLHVQRSSSSATLLMVEDNGTSAKREMLRIENTGDWKLSFRDTTDNVEWRVATGLFGTVSDTFTIGETTNGDPEFALEPSGNLTITGALTQNSDVNSKENFTELSRLDVLTLINQMPVTRWNYKFDDDSVSHVGPMAQDFYAAFQLGATEKKISPLDVASVGLVGVQQLSRQLKEKDAQIAELVAKVDALEAMALRVAELETMVNKMAKAYTGNITASMDIEQ